MFCSLRHPSLAPLPVETVVRGYWAGIWQAFLDLVTSTCIYFYLVIIIGKNCYTLGTNLATMHLMYLELPCSQVLSLVPSIKKHIGNFQKVHVNISSFLIWSLHNRILPSLYFMWQNVSFSQIHIDYMAPGVQPKVESSSMKWLPYYKWQSHIYTPLQITPNLGN